MTVLELATENTEAQNASTDNFEAIVDEHIDMIRKMVFRVVMNDHDTDDIVQEVFITAYRKLHTFRGDAKISTWLSRIAYNEAYTFLRKKKRNPIDEGVEDLDFRLGSETERPDARIKTNEAHSEITKAMLSLPEQYRSVITLISIEEKSADEAAYILNCNKPTLYWRLHKARKLLKKELGHLL